MLSKRSYLPEQMDDFEIQDERLEKALNELKIINKFLGGNSVSFAGISKLLNDKNANKEVCILDAGAGSSDILLELQHRLKNIKIISVDINEGACKFVKHNSPNIITVCADMMSLPFNNKKFDIIHLSLVLHHLKESQIISLLNQLILHTSYGIVINDLRRSIFAYLGIRTLTSLFSNSTMVKNDAPLSVRRGFRKKEIEKILKDSNIHNFLIQRKWAFRWLVIIYV